MLHKVIIIYLIFSLFFTVLLCLFFFVNNHVLWRLSPNSKFRTWWIKHITSDKHIE